MNEEMKKWGNLGAYTTAGKEAAKKAKKIRETENLERTYPAGSRGRYLDDEYLRLFDVIDGDRGDVGPVPSMQMVYLENFMKLVGVVTGELDKPVTDKWKQVVEYVLQSAREHATRVRIESPTEVARKALEMLRQS